MAIYEITDDKTGKSFEIEGDRPPTKEEIDSLLKAHSSVNKKTSQVKDIMNSIREGFDKPQEGISFGSKDVAPMVLGLVGGAGGLASPVPGGAAIGGTLGYAAGKNLNRAIGLEEGGTLPEVAAKTVTQDIPEGMLQEAVGLGVGSVAGKLAAKAKAYAPNLYESAMKPSTTLKPSVVKSRIGTALKEEIPVSEKGLEKSMDIAKQINKSISDKISGATGITISRDRALMPVAELNSKVQSSDITPNSDLLSIANYIEEVQGSVGENIPIQQAQKFKQTINKQLNEYYKAVSRGGASPAAIVPKTKEAMANGLRAEMTEVFPELKTLNAREGSLIELNKSLGQAVNRIKNREIIPLLSGMALGMSSTNSVAKALMLKAIEHPGVKSNLAIALNKANPMSFGNTAKLAARIGTIEAMNMNEGEN